MPADEESSPDKGVKRPTDDPLDLPAAKRPVPVRGIASLLPAGFRIPPPPMVKRVANLCNLELWPLREKIEVIKDKIEEIKDKIEEVMEALEQEPLRTKGHLLSVPQIRLLNTAQKRLTVQLDALQQQQAAIPLVDLVRRGVFLQALSKQYGLFSVRKGDAFDKREDDAFEMSLLVLKTAAGRIGIPMEPSS